MISFIIPAHNEARLLGRTLNSLNQAAANLREPFEIIVVDDASTDATAEIAERHGAKVTQVELRQISAVRNAGARRATGDILIFVDADTKVPAATLRAAMLALKRGHVGGGALVEFDEPSVWWAILLIRCWNMIARIGRLAAGCFVFVRRPVFDAVGGFDQAYFAGEEIVFSEAVKRHGSFTILGSRVLTSNRKTVSHSLFETAWTVLILSFGGLKRWQTREGLDLWYKRRDPDRPP